MPEGTTLYPARPTVYKGVQMRSRLEAGYAAWLDRWHFDWAYEPCAFAHPELGQYLPDFLLRNVKVIRLGYKDAWKIDLFIEVKPLRPDETSEEPQRYLEIIRASSPALHLGYAYPCKDGQSEVLLLDHGCGDRMTWIEGHDGIHAPLWLIDAGIEPKDGPWHGDWWKGQE